jgi:hypothetical protein
LVKPLTHPALRAGSPLFRGAGEGLSDMRIVALTLTRTAGEGAERSEAGEGSFADALCYSAAWGASG